MSNLINIFPDTENNVYTSENLSDSASKIIVNPNDRTIWIAGMPYGNRFIPTNGDGIDSDNLPNNSEIFNDLENNKALGDHSHAEGLSTETNNVAEHACGKYNKSTEGKTIFSIGTGTDNDNRKNAIEVTNDDKVYISGIGNYNGEGEIKDLSTVINKVIGEVGLNTNLDLETGGDLTDNADNVSNAIRILDDNLVSTTSKTDGNTTKITTIANSVGLDDQLQYEPTGTITASSQSVSEAIKTLDDNLGSTTSKTEDNTTKITELGEKINNIEEQIAGGIGSDITKSHLPDDYQPSTETNENLSLRGGDNGDTVVTAFGKLEKAIIDNEQVFTNATENIAYSVGLNDKLQYEPTGTLTASSTSISEAIEILDYNINSQSSGADYAEMFEWEDGNPDSEDRVGYFVELNGNKIIKSHSIENTIGVVSGTASVISDNPFEWHNKFLKDKWGRYLKDDNGNIILNPEYDKTKEYQYRFFRKEWDAIGLIGKLFVRQDGTLSVGCKCKPSKNGIATISDDNTGYRVLEIIDDEVARILFK